MLVLNSDYSRLFVDLPTFVYITMFGVGGRLVIYRIWVSKCYLFVKQNVKHMLQ